MRFHLALIIVATAALMAGSVPQAQAQSGEWKQLFDGKDLVGWKHVGPGEMTVEDGLIRTHGGMGLLYWTGGTLGDCVIRVVFKMRDHNDNSGIYIRIPIEPREAWMPVHYGYEVQIDNEPEKSNEDDYHVDRHPVFADQGAGPSRQARAGVEHHGDHAGRARTPTSW